MAKSNSSVTTIDDAEAPAEVASKAVQPQVIGSNHDDALSGERQTVTIFQSAEPGGDEAVFLSLNGYAYQIPRGVPCSVPVEVIGILKNAVVNAISNAPGGATVERAIPRFAYQLG